MSSSERGETGFPVSTVPDLGRDLKQPLQRPSKSEVSFGGTFPVRSEEISP